MTSPDVSTLDSTVLLADALPPPRRVMLFLMLALAVLLHVVTCGWGPIEDGRDGRNAAIARELALGLPTSKIASLWQENIQTTPVQWLTAKSFQFFGINEFAARLPFGLASVFVVWMVFLCAERLGGLWRGLASGIIAATTGGAILYGRDGGGATLTAAVWIVGFYASIRLLEQKSKTHWHRLFWAAMATLLILRQPVVAIILAGSLLVSGASFREGRMRMRFPWFILSLLLFAAALFVGFHTRYFAIIPWESPTFSNLLRLLWMLFPWSILIILPGVLRLGKILRLKEFSPADALLWTTAPALFILAFFSQKADRWPESIACLWPLFAILAALIWERITFGLRIAGISLFILLAFAGLQFCNQMADPEWRTLLQPIWWMSCTVMIVFGISAIFSIRFRHSRAALLTLAASIVPLSFNLLDAKVRHDWSISKKTFGLKFEVVSQPSSRLIIDQPLDAVSDFLFYAPHGIQIVRSNQTNEIRSVDFLLLSKNDPLASQERGIIGKNRTYILSGPPAGLER